MASGTNATLITLKLEALFSIVSNMSITYTEMKNKLSTLTDNSLGFESLLNLYTPTFKKISSIDVNGSMMLAYLDFYTLYVIMYANLGPVKNLQSITENKLAYLTSTFKDVNSVFSEKTLQKQNKYVLYTDFLNPKNIDLSISKGFLQRDKLSNALSTVSGLTLPIELTKDIKPISFMIKDTDSCLNVIENSSAATAIDYSINRKGFNKVGVVQTILPMKDTNKYNSIPKVTGSIHGYFSSSISVVIRSVTFGESGLPVSISLSGSSDNLKWSDPFDVLVDTPTPIKVDDDNYDIGMSIEFTSNITPAINDAWKIEIDYITLENPAIVCTMRFATLENVSFIKWNDITRDSLQFDSHKIRYRKNEDLTTMPYGNTFYTNGLNTIIPVFEKVNDYEVTLVQNSYYVDAVDDNLVHKFDFKLSDVTATYNEYKSYGITSFNGFDATNSRPILSLGLKSREVLTGEKQFIEHTVVATTPRSVVFIPMLNDSEEAVVEYIVPSIDSFGLGTHITRFPVKEDTQIVVKNLLTGVETIGTTDDLDFIYMNHGIEDLNRRYKIEIQNYDLRSVYTVTYFPRVHSYVEATNYIKANGNWICNTYLQDSDVYWMYYKDIEGVNKLAISNGIESWVDIQDPDLGTKMIPFSGKINSIVEMRSLDKGDKSPVIFEYTLTGN